jgi:hypothetical protein
MTMADADKNSRRADQAERARHLSAGEATAFATMLLGLLNGAEAAQHRSEHGPEPAAAAEPTPPPPPPPEAAPTDLAAADHGPGHEDQHASATEAPADSAPTIQADAAATSQAPDATATVDAAPAGEAAPTHVLTPSSPVTSFSAPADHPHAAAESTGPGGTTAPSSVDLGASIHQLADIVTGFVDTSLATVSHTIANLSATVGQLTSSISDTISHLADGLTGTVASLTHDVPIVSVVEPLVTDILGSTQQATDFSGSPPHSASLLDSAGVVPTALALLHPLPLQLGFLGQPTIDGHEPHDGAFSALGVHHF